MKILFTILCILIWYNGLAQKNALPKPWINVSNRTDSLITELKNQSIDTIISYYRVRYRYDYYFPKNKTHDIESSVIIWKKNDIINFKKINEYFESKTEIRDFQIIFDYYSFNKEGIDTTSLRLKKPKNNNQKYSAISPFRTHDRFFELFYCIGKMERNVFWSGIDLESHPNYPNDYLYSLSSSLYTWTKIIEEEIMFLDINEIWSPIELKYYSKKEKKALRKKFNVLRKIYSN